MKTQTLYICEYCSTQYKNKEEAIKCEKEHNVNLSLIQKNYKHGIPYPTTIILKDNSTGEKIKYKFNGYC